MPCLSFTYIFGSSGRIVHVKRVIAKPFSGSHEMMYEYFGCGFHLNVDRVLQWLSTEEETRERDVLIYQLENLVIL